MLHNHTLVKGLGAGEFTDYGVVKDMGICVNFCCTDKACDLALMLGSTCYTLHCKTQALCKVMPAQYAKHSESKAFSLVYAVRA